MGCSYVRRDSSQSLKALQGRLGADVRIRDERALVAALGEARPPLLLDRAATPCAVLEALREAGIASLDQEDPTLLPKARKNDAELAGTRAAHHRDGAAMVRFLSWLDAQAAGGALTEIDAAIKLEECRAEGGDLHDLSFETIAAAGSNAAIMHYRVDHASNSRIEPGSLFLIDSGGQYRDGTTDITRTIAIGDPATESCEAFTRVLKGMIAISRLRFPKGLAGRDLDALARYPLWLAGQDYNHGTGHGVGSFLSVHEGPQRLSRASQIVLEPGMILSNEPGYYREGEFGIRIENLVAVTKAPPLSGADDRPMLAFETLSLAPIDRAAIIPALLSRDEIAWLDTYHARVLKELSQALDAATRSWLEGACAPL